MLALYLSLNLNNNLLCAHDLFSTDVLFCTKEVIVGKPNTPTPTGIHKFEFYDPATRTLFTDYGDSNSRVALHGYIDGYTRGARSLGCIRVNQQWLEFLTSNYVDRIEISQPINQKM